MIVPQLSVTLARDLKQRRAGDVGVHASSSIAQALLAADVVDELRLVEALRIAARGRRLRRAEICR